MELKIGHLSTFYHTAPLLIMRGDLAERLGCETDWKLFGTGPAIVEAFEHSELDLAYIGLPPAMVGMDRGVDIKCIAGGHMEGTVIVGSAGCASYPEAATLEEVISQFKGGVIGVPGKGSIHDVILSNSLSRFGLAGDVEVINFPWADEIVDAMKDGTVQGAFGTPALAVAVERYAGGKLIYPAGLLWPHNPSYGILARTGFISEETDIAMRFLALHEEATAVFRDSPEQAADTIASMVGLVDSAYVLDTLGISPKYCAQLTQEYIDCTLEFAGAMKALGYLQGDLTVERIFDRSLIEKVHPEGQHYSVM